MILAMRILVMSSVSDDFDGIDSDDNDAEESLMSLQKLYTVFLHPNRLKEVQKRMVSNKSHRIYIYSLTTQRPNHTN